MQVAIVGAGIAGLACARELTRMGCDVDVFEKSRGVGGRMATRRAGEILRFDHGAQYFTVRGDRFKQEVDAWIARGVVERWDGRIATLTDGVVQWREESTARYVGVPGMSALCRDLAEGLNVHFETHIASPLREAGRWRVRDEAARERGEYDAFITSAPAEQSAALLSAAPALRTKSAATHMNGCWAVMLAFSESLALDFDGAFVNDSPLSWISRNSSKPARAKAPETWVLHASPDWSNARIDDEVDDVMPHLVSAFWTAINMDSRPTTYATCHRWRYSIPPEPLADGCLFDSEQRAGACGDWCNGPRVEGAYLSGRAMAEAVLAVRD